MWTVGCLPPSSSLMANLNRVRNSIRCSSCSWWMPSTRCSCCLSSSSSLMSLYCFSTHYSTWTSHSWIAPCTKLAAAPVLLRNVRRLWHFSNISTAPLTPPGASSALNVSLSTVFSVCAEHGIQRIHFGVRSAACMSGH